MRKPRGILIAGNWKMNHGPAETSKFFEELLAAGKSFSRPEKLQAVLIPPFVSLAVALEKARALSISIAAQNAHWEKCGAFTGEISGPMLKELGVGWVLVGHSERRQFFGETDETVRKRAESLLEQGFRVILCMGETRAEREGSQTEAVLERQLSGAIAESGKGAAKYLDGRLVLAYEPVWAIGTGLTATPEQAEDAHKFIRKTLRSRFGADAESKTPILYGGSVTPDNVDSLLACPDVDGALVGGASLKPQGFLTLLRAGEKALGK